MRRCLAVLLLAPILGSCGGGNTASTEEVAKSWVSAVDSGDWRAACGLMIPAKTPCEQRLAVFADKDVRLLEPGGYSNGGETTDNETKFAVTTDKDDTGYFEIVERGGRSRVDLQFTAEAYDGP